MPYLIEAHLIIKVREILGEDTPNGVLVSQFQTFSQTNLNNGPQGMHGSISQAVQQAAAYSQPMAYQVEAQEIHRAH